VIVEKPPAPSVAAANGSVPFHLAPTPSAIVRDDVLDDRRERSPIDGVASADRDRARGLIAMAAGDDAQGIRHYATVVQKDVDVVLGGEERADVACKTKYGSFVRLIVSMTSGSAACTRSRTW
jgi:hypothetical protein